jgi:adenosylhomocysteine nucleosidase
MTRRHFLSSFPPALVIALALLSPAGAAAQAPAGGGGVDLVVQGAVDSELQPLLAALEDTERVQIAAWTFWRGRIAGRTVVVSRTEVGPVNAAAATTLAIERFKPRLIVNQGTAGADDPDLKVFDIVVGEATVDYGAFRSLHRDAGTGVDLAGWTPMPHRLRLDGTERVEFKTFPGDAATLAVAMDTPYKRGRVLKGTIGSAFEFNREIDRLTWVRKAYGAISEDMESAYAGGVAAGFRTPFLAIRIISDSEFHSPEMQVVAGAHCAAFVLDVIKRLPKS